MKAGQGNKTVTIYHLTVYTEGADQTYNSYVMDLYVVLQVV